MRVALLGVRGDVEADSGTDVTSDLPLVVTRSDRYSLFGRLNAGGTRLWAHTDLGTVALRAIER